MFDFKKQNKSASLLFPVFVLFVLIFCFFGTNKIEASGNVYGWAWTENIGWISFNRDTCPADANVVGGGGADYGVNIGADGKLSGYAWSENIGWINFSPAGTFPTTPNFSAYVDLPGLSQVCPGGTAGDYKICGWARACSVFQTGCIGALNINRGGWDGWIRIHDNAYLDISSSPAQFRQWFWGGNTNNDPNASVIGWGTFNCKEGGVGGAPVCLNTTVPNAKANYRVVTTLAITDECVGNCYCNALKQCVPGGTTPSSCSSSNDCQKLPPDLVQWPWPNSALGTHPLENELYSIDYCNNTVWFQWLYKDINNPEIPQSKFDFQVSSSVLPNKDTDACPNCEVNRQRPNISIVGDLNSRKNTQSLHINFTPTVDSLTYGTTYYWRARVYNAFGVSSVWRYGISFTLKKHPYPDTSFSAELQSPTLVNGSDTGTFTDKSICYQNDGTNNHPNIEQYNCNENNPVTNNPNNYKWWFEIPTVANPIQYINDNSLAPNDSTVGDTSYEYKTKGGRTPTLEVCDELGCCFDYHNINIRDPANVPQWQEISPF